MKNKQAEAEAFGHLGAAYNAIKRHEKALAFLTQELAIFETNKDLLGQYKAYGHIANHYRTLKKVTFAVKAFEDQAELGKRLNLTEICTYRKYFLSDYRSDFFITGIIYFLF